MTQPTSSATTYKVAAARRIFIFLVVEYLAFMVVSALLPAEPYDYTLFTGKFITGAMIVTALICIGIWITTEKKFQD